MHGGIDKLKEKKSLPQKEPLAKTWKNTFPLTFQWASDEYSDASIFINSQCVTSATVDASWKQRGGISTEA